ncbi:hypothetical protein BSN85_35220 [Bradyrhizobium brasilense]|uniref:hypothetical protein n=1 Tax=Bradyrhizobium brasilense TaxID=1419277 RepID=UPI0009762BE7|nr:hypothetical protein [Bradyrhizobium brasilense]OMI00053.1 hypothetical protein BSN85_35220 [Bradyrhizobium brasilense]
MNVALIAAHAAGFAHRRSVRRERQGALLEDHRYLNMGPLKEHKKEAFRQKGADDAQADGSAGPHDRSAEHDAQN